MVPFSLLEDPDRLGCRNVVWVIGRKHTCGIRFSATLTPYGSLNSTYRATRKPRSTRRPVLFIGIDDCGSRLLDYRHQGTDGRNRWRHVFLTVGILERRGRPRANRQRLLPRVSAATNIIAQRLDLRQEGLLAQIADNLSTPTLARCSMISSPISFNRR